ncbi:MAG: hypothetical protein M3141_01790 [Actinomycetota bacterium]|nr:hypothetical protein [Actinomycetota bacterium]
MRIAVDIDSTLHHYWGQLAEVAQRRFGVALPYDEQHTWDIDLLTPVQLAECVAETHGPELVAAAQPYPGAVEVIAGWRARGHTIHVASHRAPAAQAHTAEWLERIGLPFDELRCDYGKVDWAQAAGIDLLVDDSPANLLHAREAGIVPATLRHPWNAALCAREGIACAEDWPGLGDALAELLGQWRAHGGADHRAGES